MFSLICAWINGWIDNREAGDLRRHSTHYDVTVMSFTTSISRCNCNSKTSLFWQPLPLQPIAGQLKNQDIGNHGIGLVCQGRSAFWNRGVNYASLLIILKATAPVPMKHQTNAEMQKLRACGQTFSISKHSLYGCMINWWPQSSSFYWLLNNFA